jgi:ligand-binding sensor domain-containing protein/signal transduction histidine kinase
LLKKKTNNTNPSSALKLQFYWLSALIGIIILFSATSTCAQPYYFRHYGTDQGLSNSVVWCSLQGKDGFMWFGTKDGLNRFDGIHFKTFALPNKKNHTDSKDEVLTLNEDSSGLLWIATAKGLFKFEKQTEKITPVLDSLRYFKNIVFDKYNSLWFIEGSTLYHYRFQQNKLTKFDNAQYFEASGLCKTNDGTIWAGDVNGLIHRYNEVTQKFEEFDLFSKTPNTNFRTISTLKSDSNGIIYAGTFQHGLKVFNPKTISYTDIPIDESGKKVGVVYDILPVGSNEIWLATEKGLIICDRQNNRIHKITKSHVQPNALSDDAALSLCKDREGGIWVGTYFNGLNYAAHQRYSFNKYYPDNDKGVYGGNVVREICEDKDGNIWMALEELGIANLNPTTNEIKKFTATGLPGDIAFANVHGLMANNDELWIGTHYHGVDIMNLYTKKVIRHFGPGDKRNDLGATFAVTFLKTKNGTIYVGTSSGILKYEANTGTFIQINEIPFYMLVMSLIEDNEGKIWIASTNGLQIYDPILKTFTAFEQDNDKEVAKTALTSVFQDHEGYIWATTEANGLWKIDRKNGKFRRYTTEDGLPSNTCFKVLEDDNHTLWITTYKGLANLLPSNNSIFVYTKHDGLLNDQFNYNSGFKDSNGRLYFGSTKGIISFNPNDVNQGLSIPPLYFTGFQVHNKEVKIGEGEVLQNAIPYTNKINLAYNQSTFSIDFAALGYTNPEKISYSYKMEGIDTGWTVIGENRKVYFTDLKPGKYTFKITATNYNSEGKQQKELHISISPPIWASVWAYLFYAIVVFSISWYILRAYIALKDSKKAKEQINSKLDFLTNISHEIRTPLTLIKSPLEQLSKMTVEFPAIKPDIKAMEKNTDRLMNLVEQVLDFRQTQLQAYHINFTEINISDLLQETFDLFEPLAKKKKLTYSITTAQGVVISGEKEALQKILTNLLNNAIKYASGNVFIQMETPTNNDNIIEIRYINDGPLVPEPMKEKIFEPFFRLKDSNNKKGNGIGLALSRSLVELHNGKLFFDKTSDNLNRFVLRLPIHH